MKKVFKILTFLVGLVLIFAGLSLIFLVKGSSDTGWGMFFVTLGVIAIWYWKKK